MPTAIGTTLTGARNLLPPGTVQIDPLMGETFGHTGQAVRLVVDQNENFDFIYGLWICGHVGSPRAAFVLLHPHLGSSGRDSYAPAGSV